MSTEKKRSPWSWIPSLYFAQGLPYVAVNVITVIMYKRLGISNADIALYTGWLYLPWVIKPFWSPFVDIINTKRWWTLMMQWFIGFGLAAVAFSIPTPFFFQLTLAIFWFIGFVSATHDIASDGYYMIALKEHEQAAYVGIRSTFYRVATIVGQGLLVIIAGAIESGTGLEPANVTIKVNPALEAQAANTEAPGVFPVIAELTDDQKAQPQFVYSSDSITTGVKTPETVVVSIKDTLNQVVTDTVGFKKYAELMRDSVNNLNVRNGFVATDTIRALSFEDKKEADNLNWLEQTIKDLFGEERAEAKSVANNFAIVGVTLSQQPPVGEEYVLNVAYDTGDQSIKLEQDKLSTRFVFNDSTWNKTAYLFYEIDSKLTTETEAAFIGTSGNIPMAWLIVFISLAIFFLIVAMYHSWALPKPLSDKSVVGESKRSAKEIVQDFIETFKTFFKKKHIWVAMGFMLLYRLPEAQLIKIINPFFLDPLDKGGLGLTTGQVGIVYGTIGIIGLTIGGIVGGIVASRGGLKKWLWPMALSISLNSLVYIYLSAFQPDASTTSGMVTICTGMFLDQFGYGFGFTAFMLYMMYFADGPYKTSHYAICTAFMALGMMLPGMWSGWLQELIGYNHFFIWTLLCSCATWFVTSLVKVDPNYGKKSKE